MIEGLRDRADDLEPERLPEAHGRGVGFDDGVELDARETRRAAPANDILTERTAYAQALLGRVDEERRRGHVRPAAGPVGPHLRRAHDDAVADGDYRLAGRLLHPPRPGLVEGLVLGERIGLALGHDRGIERIDQWPVLIGRRPDVHDPDSTAPSPGPP